MTTHANKALLCIYKKAEYRILITQNIFVFVLLIFLILELEKNKKKKFRSPILYLYFRFIIRSYATGSCFYYQSMQSFYFIYFF